MGTYQGKKHESRDRKRGRAKHMKRAKSEKRALKSGRERNRLKEINIIEGALKVFGEKGFEGTTISAISKAANVSEATLYEYFSSKEEVLFAIPKLYTQKELDRMTQVIPYIHSPKEKIRVIIQVYLEFYEKNPLYTSVALLTLKGNRNFIKSDAYQVIRESARFIVMAFNEGVEKGVFRDDIDPYLVRNIVLGFIEHLTIQWLLIGRPARISQYRGAIFHMVMRAIEKMEDSAGIELKVKVEGINIQDGLP